tara:strand:+ start:324 stop:524 length:201 start_codon:yes stop_codon:yes gene_type:complete
MAKQKTHKTPAIETVNSSAAAVDIGSRKHTAAVNPNVTGAPVRAFGLEGLRRAKETSLNVLSQHPI